MSRLRQLLRHVLAWLNTPVATPSDQFYPPDDNWADLPPYHPCEGTPC